MKLRTFLLEWQGLILASAFSVAMLGLRMYLSGTHHYSFLLWNLFLGYIPLLISYGLMKQKKLSYWKVGTASGLWLLFFPNAPYIITDLMHLSRYKAPWVDGLMLFSFAMTSLVAGLISLLQMRAVVKPLLPVVLYRLCTVAVLLLSGFGVYLGRFERWNSWDLLTHPTHLFYNCVYNLHNPKAIAVTLTFAGCLFVTLQLIQQVSKFSYDTDKEMPL
jgi:uncharacterized membrane protein